MSTCGSSNAISAAKGEDFLIIPSKDYGTHPIPRDRVSANRQSTRRRHHLAIGRKVGYGALCHGHLPILGPRVRVGRFSSTCRPEEPRHRPHLGCPAKDCLLMQMRSVLNTTRRNRRCCDRIHAWNPAKQDSELTLPWHVPDLEDPALSSDERASACFWAEWQPPPARLSMSLREGRSDAPQLNT